MRSKGKGTQQVPKKALYNPESDFCRLAETVEPGNLPPEAYRMPSRRDYGRLIHSPAFRRLQGKTQLFPSSESDFYRNRLTHSVEVAHIAKSIALRLNSEERYCKENPIDTDLVEFSALAHDLGHPPFGHNGESELNAIMVEHGGFEGNAQTLRILTRLEKKQTKYFPAGDKSADPIVNESDVRLGLNLTARSIASILKYDNKIPLNMKERKSKGLDSSVQKGYYAIDSDTVDWVKSKVCVNLSVKKFKTVECCIMDIADDIAYSTYDLEDSFKAGFLTPISMSSADRNFRDLLARRIKKKIDFEYHDLPEHERNFDFNEVNKTLAGVFHDILISDRNQKDLYSTDDQINIASSAFSASAQLASNGYYRTDFTSALVGTFVRGIEFKFNEECPALSRVRLSLQIFKVVELLKLFSFEKIILSPRIKITDQRGRHIIRTIFQALKEEDGYMLLPNDWRELLSQREFDDNWRMRTICDFIAGMTDRYCIEFYSRLLGENMPSIHKDY